MWADINGERKKVACGPCIRGHRSSKCDHKDRVLVEVRKPGRPLSSCPHPSGSCSCERVVINYTIPKTSECACPSERTQTISSLAGASNRVQKPRPRKLTNSITPSSLEKAIKASQDLENDSSSLIASTPTNPSFAPSERSASNEASAPSSASSTPRILPSPSRKQSYSADFRLSNASLSSDSRPPTSQSEQVSDCCKTKPAPVQQQGGSCCKPKPEPVVQQSGSCCSNKAKEPLKVVPVKKSCCSGSSQSNQAEVLAQLHQQPNTGQNLGTFPPFQQQAQYYNAPYGMMSPGFNYNMSSNIGTPVPFGFNTPIYNHMAGSMQQPGPISNMPMHTGAHHVGTRGTEHNCHCGDGCSCFGCAAHPNNATMAEYIRAMHQYMSTGGFGAMPPPTYDMPSHPQSPGLGTAAAQNMNYNPNQPPANFHHVSVGQTPFPAHVNPMMSIPNTPVNMTNPWRQSSTHTTVQSPTTTDAQFFSPSITQEAPLPLKAETSAPSPATVFADSPSDGKEEDASTLSPSSYFWQELVLPGCNDATGTCQCGDGCECVGCLTHGGHNGIPLEPLDAPTGITPDILHGLEVNEWDLPNHAQANHGESFKDFDPQWNNTDGLVPESFGAPPDSSVLW